MSCQWPQIILNHMIIMQELCSIKTYKTLSYKLYSKVSLKITMAPISVPLMPSLEKILWTEKTVKLSVLTPFQQIAMLSNQKAKIFWKNTKVPLIASFLSFVFTSSRILKNFIKTCQKLSNQMEKYLFYHFLQTQNYHGVIILRRVS